MIERIYIYYLDFFCLSMQTKYMATFSQIKEVRLRIDDPAGYQDILELASAVDLPATPAPYTAYKLSDTGAYVATDLESGAIEADYERQELRVSDSRISDWIDDYSVDQAECKALSAIATRLGSEVRLRRVSGGAETTEWTALKDLYIYYKALSNECKERNRKSQGNSTGRYGTSDQPEIAGGEL